MRERQKQGDENDMTSPQSSPDKKQGKENEEP